MVGVADEERGQIVKAFVVLKEGHAPGPQMVKDLQEFVKQTIAPYKYPRAVEFRASLPTDRDRQAAAIQAARAAGVNAQGF